jgi:hypothetical protein
MKRLLARLAAWLRRLVFGDNRINNASATSTTSPSPHPGLPLVVKIAYGLIVLLVIPLWWREYGPSNFLWFSDLTLFGGLIAAWLDSPLLVGMIALAALLPEFGWNISFFARLAGVRDALGLADYMFDRRIPTLVRGLSLFHVALPPFILWMLVRLRYDRRALLTHTLLAWLVLPMSYLFATSGNNINWTLGVGSAVPQTRMPGWLWVAVLMIGFPLLIYVPTHIALSAIFKPLRPNLRDGWPRARHRAGRPSDS